MKQIFLTLSIPLFMLSCGGEETTKDKATAEITETDPIKIELADLISDINEGLEIYGPITEVKKYDSKAVESEDGSGSFITEYESGDYLITKEYTGYKGELNDIKYLIEHKTPSEVIDLEKYVKFLDDLLGIVHLSSSPTQYDWEVGKVLYILQKDESYIEFSCFSID